MSPFSIILFSGDAKHYGTDKNCAEKMQYSKYRRWKVLRLIAELFPADMYSALGITIIGNNEFAISCLEEFHHAQLFHVSTAIEISSYHSWLDLLVFEEQSLTAVYH